MTRWCNGFALMFSLLCVGCGGGAPFERAAVDGVVKVDGQPLADGVILFVPDGKTAGPVARGVITEGAFKIELSDGPSVGTQKVQITSTKKTGKTVSVEGVDTEEVIQFLPDLYNLNTNLTADIKRGTNTLPPFELKSKIERKGIVLPGGVVPSSWFASGSAMVNRLADDRRVLVPAQTRADARLPQVNLTARKSSRTLSPFAGVAYPDGNIREMAACSGCY